MIAKLRGGWIWVALLLAALVVGIRLDGIADTSITQDEATMVLFAEGVLDRGYPFLRRAGEEFLISTYELVPYPIAASLGLLGFSELAARLPSVLFAAATTMLLFWFASRTFDRRIGALAAVLFAILPWAQYWGSNAFYLSQAQFFVLLTAALIHRVLFTPRPPPWLFYSIFVTFSLSYLSWEGSGFMGVVFALSALTMRWRRWPWITDRHAWCSGALIILLVNGQLTYRTVLREPFKGIGGGRSDISFAKPVFLKPDLDTEFYIHGLLAEHHVVLIFFLLIGLYFCVRNENMRYLYFIPAAYLFILTFFLGYYALRYAYIMLPLLVIASAAAAILLGDALMTRFPRPELPGTRGARWIMPVLFAFTLLITAGPWGVQPGAPLADDHRNPRIELMPGHRGFSFRLMAERLAELHQPGDAIISQAPFPLSVYTGLRSDYLLQTVTMTQIFYALATSPFYADKWLGSPVLRTAEELQEVLNSHRRVWFVAAPYGATRSMAGKELHDRIVQDSELVAEGILGKLFLWHNPRFAGRE